MGARRCRSTARAPGRCLRAHGREEARNVAKCIVTVDVRARRADRRVALDRRCIATHARAGSASVPIDDFSAGFQALALASRAAERLQ
jgi:hypothetical protein